MILGGHLTHDPVRSILLACRVTGVREIDSQPLRQLPALGCCFLPGLLLQGQCLIDQTASLLLGTFGMQAQAFRHQGSQFGLLVASPFAFHVGSDLARGVDMTALDPCALPA